MLEGSNIEVKQREREGVVILDLEGHLVLGEEAFALRQRAVSLLEAGQRNLILDLKGVTEIDITGVSALAFFGEKIREAGGTWVFLNLGPAPMAPSGCLKR